MVKIMIIPVLIATTIHEIQGARNKKREYLRTSHFNFNATKALANTFNTASTLTGTVTATANALLDRATGADTKSASTNTKGTKSKKQQSIRKSLKLAPEWKNIDPPLKSYFAGFDSPSNVTKWEEALLSASRGEQVLLMHVLKEIRSPFDLWKGDPYFKWIHRVAERHESKANSNIISPGPYDEGVTRAQIVMLGYTTFDAWGFEGTPNGGFDLELGTLLNMQDPPFRFADKSIAIGRMNENFGYLSTYFLNRTYSGNGHSLCFYGECDPFNKDFVDASKAARAVLDDPNLLMMVVNQHHNMSHPKVISLPLGIQQPRDMWKAMQKAVKLASKKSTLLYSGGSNWGFRPRIRECVAGGFNTPGAFFVSSGKLDQDKFRAKLLGSMAVLCMPGQGYDTYRLWEALASGAMPVIEKGMGMDRTLYRLPALLLDDYADLTEHVVRQAYVEALYRAEEWEYARMTQRWYEGLMYEVAEAASIEPLLRLHPITAEDATFTRPLIPFTCPEGECGEGTKRTPSKSCAIDPSIVKKGYRWDWVHRAPDVR